MVYYDEKEGRFAQKTSKAAGAVLGLAQWQMAFDAYALAAAMLGQMTYQSAMCHKRLVCEIACNAAGEQRNTLLGVLYDSIVR